ncbi:MAG: hypothetical protein AAF639_46005 [Chloroflexota bacterium]
MSTISNSFALLLALLSSLLLLAWLSRQISLYVQKVILHITGSTDMAGVVLFLILLPGIFLHESAHWLMARFLGLKTSKFRVWPRKKGKYIGMGSVNVQRGGIWLDSLVGAAPLLAGSIAIAIIGEQVFSAYTMAEMMAVGRWLQGIRLFWDSLGNSDGIMWAYLTFAIANAMMPSASDRQPILPVLLYIGFAITIYIILGLPLTPFNAIVEWLYLPLQALTSALVFTIVLDLFILGILYIFELSVMNRRPPPKKKASRTRRGAKS